MGDSSPSTARVILSALLLFAACAITVPGGMVLKAHPESYDDGPGTCRSTYLWVTFFLLCTWVATICVIVALFTTYRASGPDLNLPRDAAARPNAISLPVALTSDKVFRAGAALTAVVWTCFFISGCVLLHGGSCSSLAYSLSLFMRFMFWGLVVVGPTMALCGWGGSVMMQSMEADSDAKFDPIVEQAEEQLAAAQIKFRGNEANSAAQMHAPVDIGVIPSPSAGASAAAASASVAGREELSVV